MQSLFAQLQNNNTSQSTLHGDHFLNAIANNIETSTHTQNARLAFNDAPTLVQQQILSFIIQEHEKFSKIALLNFALKCSKYNNNNSNNNNNSEDLWVNSLLNRLFNIVDHHHRNLGFLQETPSFEQQHITTSPSYNTLLNTIKSRNKNKNKNENENKSPSKFPSFTTKHSTTQETEKFKSTMTKMPIQTDIPNWLKMCQVDDDEMNGLLPLDWIMLSNSPFTIAQNDQHQQSTKRKRLQNLITTSKIHKIEHDTTTTSKTTKTTTITSINTPTLLTQNSPLDTQSENSQIKPDEPIESEIEIDTEFWTSIHAKLLKLQNQPPPYTNQIPTTFFSTFQTSNSIQIKKILSILQLHTLDDELLFLICSNVITSDTLYQSCFTFIEHSILPKVISLTQGASRVFVATLTHITKMNPKAVVYALLLNLIQIPNQGLNTSHADLMNRLIKHSFPPELVIEFFQQALHITKTNNVLIIWNDSLLTVFNHIINLQFSISDTLISSLISCASEKVTENTTNPKFSNLLFQLIQKYPTQVKAYSNILYNVLKECKTFITKGALDRLSKL